MQLHAQNVQDIRTSPVTLKNNVHTYMIKSEATGYQCTEYVLMVLEYVQYIVIVVHWPGKGTVLSMSGAQSLQDNCQALAVHTLPPCLRERVTKPVPRAPPVGECRHARGPPAGRARTCGLPHALHQLQLRGRAARRQLPQRIASAARDAWCAHARTHSASHARTGGPASLHYLQAGGGCRHDTFR